VFQFGAAAAGVSQTQTCTRPLLLVPLRSGWQSADVRQRLSPSGRNSAQHVGQ
jgi:hypothetical protein